jgi:agmatine deiminase
VFRKDGTLLGHYRKTHIPHDEGFFEQNYFTPGDSGFVVFDTGIAKIGVLICYDQWFPEAARAMALAGAEVIFYPTAIGAVEGLPQSEGDWQTSWEAVQRGHAIANNVAVAAINRVGTEGRSMFWGGSFLYDAFGKLIAHGGNGEEIVVGTVDLELNSIVREGWGFFRNRRPEAYGALTSR